MTNTIFNKKLWIAIFYIMSPYFPGNNFLELAMIGSIVGMLTPIIPDNWDLGLTIVVVYLIYNSIAVLGLYLLQKNQKFLTIKNLIEITILILVLFYSGYIPEPYGTIFLVFFGLYFLFKNGNHKQIISYLRKNFESMKEKSNPIKKKKSKNSKTSSKYNAGRNASEIK